jgi:MFS family permease
MSSPSSLPRTLRAESAPLDATPRTVEHRTVERRTLLVACGAHVLHDGFADVLLLLLPIWRREFALVYAEVGMIRALYTGAMAGFQIPVGMFAERVGGRVLLTEGTAMVGLGFLLAGVSSGFAMLAAALVLGGIGASVQHPIGSGLVSRAVAAHHSRAALATYNFSGDVGKMLLPTALAGLLLLMPWQPAVLGLGGLGLAGAAALWLLVPAITPGPARPRAERPAVAAAAERHAGDPASRVRGGFPLLLSIGVIDTATRTGFLTFLPFLLTAKGAEVSTLGLALTLVFAGGAAGKLVCGLIGARIGVLATVILTEGLTAAGILALLPLPLEAALAVLPVLGVALNGTSSVLYGTVPELVPEHRRERAFGIFYTGTIGGGAVAPMLFGMAGDWAGIPVSLGIAAGLVLATLPLAWLLRPALAEPAPVR